MKVFAVLALLVCAVSAKSLQLKEGFSYKNCDPNTDIQLTALSVTPDPIVIPGTVTVSLTITGKEDVTDPTDFAIALKKSVDGSWVDIPCVGSVGSCDYPSVCENLATRFPDGAGCPATILASGLNCNCPITAGTYTITDLTVDVALSPNPDIIDGDYEVDITANNAAGVQIACINIFATIDVVEA